MNKSRYIEQVDFRDMNGDLLWSEKMIFKRLYAVGQEFIENRKCYIVKRVDIKNKTVHLNVIKVSPKLETNSGIAPLRSATAQVPQHVVRNFATNI